MKKRRPILVCILILISSCQRFTRTSANHCVTFWDRQPKPIGVFGVHFGAFRFALAVWPNVSGLSLNAELTCSLSVGSAAELSLKYSSLAADIQEFGGEVATRKTWSRGQLWTSRLRQVG